MTDHTMKDGGPAYPQPQVADGQGGIEYTEVEGMSLRDWFAGQAIGAQLTSIAISDASAKALLESASIEGVTVKQKLASKAYEMADAMLDAREAPCKN